MADHVLNVKNLSVDIPLADGVLHAVDGIDIHVDRGETLCIVGESGCGKSLTSLAIMDLLPKKAIRTVAALDLGGESILDYSERQMSDIRGNRMGMIFQEPMTSLNPAFTIGNQMVETLHRHRNISGRAAQDLAKHMLEKVGITAAAQRLNQYPHQLSGGLRQRVMIAMTLLCEPELIIADEPTTALDVTIQAQILLLLQELQTEFDMGLILITHDLGVVARIATRVAVMYAGQIVEQGTVAQIFDNPMHPYTRGLMQCIPVPGKTRPGEPLGSIPGMVPSLIGRFTGCRFVDRCSLATDACRSDDIALRDATDATQAYRCILDPRAMAKVA
ncbi:MAG: ABC transporter ATP-binding protein [Alphaproteobacteria bacterium]|nr:ABC transporter ATP-binding protein [Alphaproteobacteria bacterium]